MTSCSCSDVREDEEWTAGRIDGATRIPPVVTVWRSGGRAGRAADYLAHAGRAAEVMDGGMTSWTETGLPARTPHGRPGRVA